MIVVVDYDCGNIASVLNMIRKCGGVAIASSDVNVIATAEKLILPGVGSFDYGMNMLIKYNLVDTILQFAKSNKPILGICLGMQLLCNNSEEGKMYGLGLIDAEVLKFKFVENLNLRVPHVGWNYVDNIKKNKLIDFIDNEKQKFYFVHSYYVKCRNSNNVIATSSYGLSFDSFIISDSSNIYGVQFHPEKSHRFGLKLLSNFINLKC